MNIPISKKRTTALVAAIILLILTTTNVLALGVIERVSVHSSGAESDANHTKSAISDNGRYVAFESDAADLVDGDINGFKDVFRHDRVTGDTTLVSVHTDGTQGNDHSTKASISDDGRYVAFLSYATNLVDDDTNNAWDIFVRDTRYQYHNACFG